MFHRLDDDVHDASTMSEMILGFDLWTLASPILLLKDSFSYGIPATNL